MHNIIRLKSLNDFYLELDKRDNHGVFFYRINKYNIHIQNFLVQYYKVAKTQGTIIDGGIVNPTNQNLQYYNEMVGTQFKLDKQFIQNAIHKWLPRLSDGQVEYIGSATYNVLMQFKQAGKSESILKNVYIKFMCWFYYKFERILSKLGKNVVPKVLYLGTINLHELLFLQILSGAGCDIVMIQVAGDNEYLKLDPLSKISYDLVLKDMTEFPSGFGIKSLVELNHTASITQANDDSIQPSTNTWIQKLGFDDILTNTKTRDSDKNKFYNAFIRINGVNDKNQYEYKLYQFYQQLIDDERDVVVIDSGIVDPSPNEIKQIRRGNYTSCENAIVDLKKNILSIVNDSELQKIISKGFVEVLLEESKVEGMTVGKIVSKAVYLLCWLRKYSSKLFPKWKQRILPCFIYLGGCQNSNVALFIRLLSRLPIDVLLIRPNLYNQCIIKDSRLCDITYQSSLDISRFPTDGVELQVSTNTYNAFNSSNSYNEFINSYKTINILNLKTVYEEIFPIWKQSIELRPNYSLVGTCVNIPTLYAKVTGVDTSQAKYWNDVKELIDSNTLLIKEVPYISPNNFNPFTNYAKSFLKGGKLQRDKIKNYSEYQYTILHDDMQNILLDKIQLMLDQKIIRGTYSNGVEYKVIATALNLPMEILRMIKIYDVTKTNPKLLLVNTMEIQYSLEDAIIVSLLHLIGFDILFFSPTGYPTIEKHLSKNNIVEHNIGSYMYDLSIPNFDGALSMKMLSWKDKFLNRRS